MKKLALLIVGSLLTLCSCFTLLACETPCEHTYGEWTEVSSAECDVDGLQKRTCSKCNHVDEEVIPMFGHSEIEDAAVEPQIGQTGLTAGSHCETCGDTIVAQTVIPALVLFSASSSNSSLGTVSITSQGVSVGDTITVVATATKGVFEGWYHNGNLVCSELTFTFVMPEGGYEVQAKFSSLADVWNGDIATAFEGGKGTETEPYLIATASQLAYMAKMVNTKDDIHHSYAHYKLTSDIDLNNIPWTPIGTFYYGSSMSNASLNMAFCGYFDGNGKTISNLKISTSETSYHKIFGLFGRINQNDSEVRSAIKNLTITNADVSSSNSEVAGIGILAGQTYMTNIENCHVSGKVGGGCSITSASNPNLPTLYAGGLIGRSYSATNVVRCSSNVSINVTTTGGAAVGGLIGDATSVKVYDCFSNGTVKAKITEKFTAMVGGLIGSLAGSNPLTYCSSLANVSVVNEGTYSPCVYAGGLLGTILNTKVSNCFAKGSVDATCTSIISAGGFIGYVMDSNANDLTISECYSTGSVDAKLVGSAPNGICVAGFVANAYNMLISNCFTTSSVTANSESTSIPYKYFGKFIATDNTTGNNHSNVFALDSITIKENGNDVSAFNETPETSCTVENLNTPAFYVDSLKWDSTKWIFDYVDASNDIFPIFSAEK